MSRAYFLGKFCWCFKINCTYLKNMIMAHTNGSFVWNIHMSGTYAYVKCTFTPHPNLEYFIYFNVRCTKYILCTCCTSMREGCYIAYVLESQLVVIFLQYMIFILIVFYLYRVFIFAYNISFFLLFYDI
jgi:hypothetical protein